MLKEKEKEKIDDVIFKTVILTGLSVVSCSYGALFIELNKFSRFLLLIFIVIFEGICIWRLKVKNDE